MKDKKKTTRKKPGIAHWDGPVANTRCQQGRRVIKEVATTASYSNAQDYMDFKGLYRER